MDTILQKTLHILIADDDKEDLELLEESLRKTTCVSQLSTVHNGRAVLDFLIASAIDKLPSLIVLDYNMPALNGFEVLSILNNDARYKSIPVVILSTSDSPTHIKECKSKGAVSFFVKPQSIAELDRIAEKMIALCS